MAFWNRKKRLQDVSLGGTALGVPGLNLRGIGGSSRYGNTAVNPSTGLGGRGDKAASAYFALTRELSAHELEALYTQSWVARKIIDIPIDDMFAKGRTWTGDDEDAIEAMKEAERHFFTHERLAKAMKVGRLFGSGMLILVFKGEDHREPLDWETFMEKTHELSSVMVTDRCQAKIHRVVVDTEDRMYGCPEIYQFQPQYGGNLLYFHSSRVLRFDGQAALNTDGWHFRGEDYAWGVSDLNSLIGDILNDSTIASGLAHLAQEASVGVLKAQGLRDAMSGTPDPDEPSVEQMGEKFNQTRSIYGTLFIDANDDYSRVGVNFGGLVELMDKFSVRIAAMAGIPATRFLSQSPAGLNATGESDMKNYALHVGAMQAKLLDRPMRMLDKVLAKFAGLQEPPEYEWLPLMEMSLKEKGEGSKIRAEALAVAYDRGALDENEMREQLSKDETFGELPPIDLEGKEEEEAAAKAAAEAALLAAGGGAPDEPHGGDMPGEGAGTGGAQ